MGNTSIMGHFGRAGAAVPVGSALGMGVGAIKAAWGRHRLKNKLMDKGYTEEEAHKIAKKRNSYTKNIVGFGALGTAAGGVYGGVHAVKGIHGMLSKGSNFVKTAWNNRHAVPQTAPPSPPMKALPPHQSEIKINDNTYITPPPSSNGYHQPSNYQDVDYQ